MHCTVYGVACIFLYVLLCTLFSSYRVIQTWMTLIQIILYKFTVQVYRTILPYTASTMITVAQNMNLTRKCTGLSASHTLQEQPRIVVLL